MLLIACAAFPARGEVIIEGVNGVIAKAIRANLSLPEGCDQSDWLVRYRFRSSKKEIETTLQTFGYYSPKIAPRLAFEPKCWKAHFRIDPGPPAIISGMRVTIEGEGSDLAAFARVLDATPIRKGNRFDPDGWEALKSDIAGVAARFGFLRAAFVTHQASVDAVHNTVDVELTYDTGPRFHFGRTTFETDALDGDLLRRYVPYKEGDAYDPRELGVLYQSLLDSGYFDDVMIDTGQVSGTVIDVRVVLSTARKSRTRLGLGYSTDLGPSVSIGRNVSLVNRRGHQLNADLSISPVQTKFGGYYRMPRAEAEGSWISIYGGFLDQHTDTSRSSETTLGVRRVIPLKSGWVETRFLEIANNRFDVAGVENSSVTVVPGINFSHTHTDSVSARPQHAHTFMAELSGTSSALGSTVEYVSVTARAKVIRGFTDRIRFIGRGKVGAVWSNRFGELPPVVRFFAGGDESVRGYGYQEIGAVDANGNVVGGDRIAEVSGEFDYLFRPRWAVAVFLDAGSVSLSAFPSTFEKSAGLGVRWYSPIGPVRIDFAQPLHAPGRGVKLHISLGPDI